MRRRRRHRGLGLVPSRGDDKRPNNQQRPDYLVPRTHLKTPRKIVVKEIGGGACGQKSSNSYEESPDNRRAGQSGAGKKDQRDAGIINKRSGPGRTQPAMVDRQRNLSGKIEKIVVDGYKEKNHL